MKRAAFLLLTLILTGCATVSVPTRLRSQDDLRPAGGNAKAYELPDSAMTIAPRAWGHLAADSLVLYRPIGDADGSRTYRRQARDVGSSGVEIAGYTLADGRHFRLDGTVKRAGDRLEFERRWRSMEKVDTTLIVHAVDQVQSIDVRVPSASRTTLLWGIILVTAAAGFALGVGASLNESAM